MVSTPHHFCGCLPKSDVTDVDMSSLTPTKKGNSHCCL